MTRTLPNVDARNRVNVPSLGTFHVQAVGNTADTTGLDIHFHRHGEPESEQGSMRISCAISPDYEVVWRRMMPRHAINKADPFTPAIVGWALQIASDLKDRDPVGWMFQVLGAVDIEIRATDARAQMRGTWRRNPVDPIRLARLEHIHKIIMEWCNLKNPKTSIVSLIADALKENAIA